MMEIHIPRNTHEHSTRTDAADTASILLNGVKRILPLQKCVFNACFRSFGVLLKILLFDFHAKSWQNRLDLKINSRK